MKPALAPVKQSTRGGILLTVMIIMIAAALVCAGSISGALTSLRMAQRNDMRSEMTIVADAELEWLFFNVKMAVMSGTSMSGLSGNARLAAAADFGSTPTTVRETYLNEHQATGWRVKRSVRHLLSTRGIDRSSGGSRRSLLDYIEAKVIVIPPVSGSFAGLPEVRIGRYFVVSQATIFQYGVFFDGDLELNPGEDYTLNGDIYASGDAYLAPISGKTLTITEDAKLRLIEGKKLNGSLTATTAGTTRYNPNAPTASASLVDPFFNLTGGGAPAKIIPATGSEPATTLSQLERLGAEENLLGGLDALATAQARPDLFGPNGKGDATAYPPSSWTEAEKIEAMNNVKRSLIVPPPNVASTAEYPNLPTAGDDPSISVQRAYNRAGMIITVEANGSVTVESQASSGTKTNITSTMMQLTGLIGNLLNPPANPIASSTPISMYDAREGLNVKVTEIDVAALKAKLGNSSNFNGLLYVNLKNSTSTAPAAVRIINAENVPVTAGGGGLSIATNGGLYIKGSYNTTPSGTVNSEPVYPSSMLMADSITVLSYDWNDANANAEVEANRLADVDNPATGTAETALKINAGLLTGNVATTSLRSSGGAQNLIRYLENWSGKEVSFLGSLGRLFNSKHMVRPFLGPSTVYRAPNRTVRYDVNLSNTPPAGSPILTQFSAGYIFSF